MDKDRKENRRNSYKTKSFKKYSKDFSPERKDNIKLKNAYKQKKRVIEEQETWENWQDEIY